MSQREDLENLLKSPGWLLVVEQAREEWATGYPRKIKMAIQSARESGQDIAAAVSAIDVASDAVNALMSWPGERLKKLVMKDEAQAMTTTGWPDPSRRGGF
jgi:hypothetical protein